MSARNPRIGAYYSVGCGLSLALAWASWPYGAFLLWPAAALGYVAAGYFGYSEKVYTKSGGRLARTSEVFLAPVIFGQWVSLRYYATRSAIWNELTPKIWIGRRLTHEECRQAVGKGVTAVLDLTAEFSEAAPFLDVDYLNLPILDLTAPTRAQLEEAALFIKERAEKGTVYVHCKVGYSRTAAAVGAYLLRYAKARDVDDVVRMLEAARPGIVVRPEVREALRAFTAADARSGASPTAPAA